MATSGSINFSVTRNEIIEMAHNALGILDEGSELSDREVTDAAKVLNAMIKSWKSKHGLNLWCYQEITVFPAVDRQSYLLGATGSNASTDYNSTQIATDATSGASSISVDDATGISDGDFIGIQLDSGDLQWTTVNGTPAANVITLDDTLDDDVSEGGYVYSYTTLAGRPLRVTSARYSDANGNETPLTEASRSDYFNLSTKSSSNIPNQFYYDPQLTNGILYIWPTFSSVNNLLKLTVQRQIEDFDLAVDNPDFPQEWYEPLYFNLARRLITVFSITNPTTVSEIKEMAAETLKDIKDADQEPCSIQFMPYGDHR